MSNLTDLLPAGAGGKQVSFVASGTIGNGVTEPEDWYGCKYNYVDGAWELCPDWVDPRLGQ